MKTIKYLLSLALVFFISCSDDDNDLSFVDNVAAPSNVSALFQVTQDNTGLVTITPNSDGGVSYNVILGDDTEEAVSVGQGENIEHTYAEGTYTVSLEAVGISGLTAMVAQELVVSFNAPENLVVTIENDEAVSKQVNVTTTADFAMSFEVDFGDGSDVVQANIGETASHVFQDVGLYTITITAMGASIETTTYTEVDFEVTAILQPIASAPGQPFRQDSDLISVFSDAYTDIAGTDFFPNWGQSTVYTAFDLNGDAMIQYSNLNYEGINIGAPIIASDMETLHIDIWTADEDLSIDIYPLPGGVVPADERFVTKSLVANQWNSFDIPLTDFSDQGLPLDNLMQFKFVGTPAGGTVFIDNLYFYKEGSSSTFDDGLLTNGDFESGSDSWIVGVDDSSPAPVVTVSGNTYYSVDVATAGNPWDVNVSQKVEITEGNSYTFTFDAWSDTDRSIITGIGLSADPWSSSTETVNITTTRTTYTLTLSAADFGAIDARVIFDLGADAGTVNIDNVSLVLGTGNILTNGDFESGSDSWIVGVDDSSPAPVVTVDGNTYYSVDVATAGNPWDVNVSQKVEIIEGNTYFFTFDAWSDTDRSIITGIGLSADPWSSSTETVNITSTRTTYTLTLSAADFGATDARVIFDLGADSGAVNLDNVSLSPN